MPNISIGFDFGTWRFTHGNALNCDDHQAPFLPHCTMRRVLDCKKYQGGSWRRTLMSMPREEGMAMHSRQCHMAVTRQSCGCSWRRALTSMPRVESMAMHSRWHCMAVMRQSCGCSWGRTSMSTPRVESMATHSRWHHMVVTRPSCNCFWRRTPISTSREDTLAMHSWWNQLTVMMGSRGFSKKKANTNVQGGEHSSMLHMAPRSDVPLAYPFSRRAQQPQFKDEACD